MSFYIMPGTNIGYNSGNSLADAKLFAPNSTILQKDYSVFKKSHLYGNHTNGDGVALMFGFHRNLPRKKENSDKPSRELRFSAGLLNGNDLSLYVENRVSTPYDTLYSALTQQPTGIVLLETNDVLSVSNFYTNAIFDLSLITEVRSPFERLSFYRGWGLNTQFSVRNETSVISMYSGPSLFNGYTLPPDYPYPQPIYSTLSEQVINPMHYSMGLYVPLGITYQVSEKNRVLKHFNIFVEGRPGVFYFAQPVRDLSNFYFNYNLSFGIKYV